MKFLGSRKYIKLLKSKSFLDLGRTYSMQSCSSNSLCASIPWINQTLFFLICSSALTSSFFTGLTNWHISHVVPQPLRGVPWQRFSDMSNTLCPLDSVSMSNTYPQDYLLHKVKRCSELPFILAMAIENLHVCWPKRWHIPCRKRETCPISPLAWGDSDLLQISGHTVLEKRRKKECTCILKVPALPQEWRGQHFNHCSWDRGFWTQNLKSSVGNSTSGLSKNGVEMPQVSSFCR